MSQHIESQNIIPVPNAIVNDYRKYGQKFKTFEQRFWEKVDKVSSPHGCWLWLACRRGKYGAIKWKEGKHVGVHRVSWMIHKGDIPVGMCVCHNCPGGDNPICVNPDHLFIGTNADNMADCHNKNRHTHGDNTVYRLYPELIMKGVDHPLAKVTEDDVRTIRARRAAGEMFKTIGLDYGMTKSAIFAICKRKTWPHVT